MKNLLFITTGMVLGGLLIAGIFIANPIMIESLNLSLSDKPVKEISYWVAPMDDSFRRDEPGLSPMGMELVPVYKELKTDVKNALYISPNVENNIGVRTDKAFMGTLSPQVRTVGLVSYDEDKLVHIHPRIHGWIEHLHVKSSGDKVNKGDPIYSLYSPELVNAQDEYLLALSSNNERLIRGAASRLKALRISDSFIRRLKRTRRAKQTVTFYSMQDGIVENLNIRQGFYVEPGTTLMSIANLEQVWIVAEVFESQAQLIKKGQKVSITLDYMPNKIWRSSVDYISPTVNPSNRSVNIRILLSNKDQLFKPNMFSNVSIDVSNKKELVLVPKEAVIRTGLNNRVIIALGDGQYQAREVILGHSDDQYYSVIQGVESGEVIVTSAQFLIDSESNKTAAFKRIERRSNDLPADMNTSGGMIHD